MRNQIIHVNSYQRASSRIEAAVSSSRDWAQLPEAPPADTTAQSSADCASDSLTAAVIRPAFSLIAALVACEIAVIAEDAAVLVRPSHALSEECSADRASRGTPLTRTGHT